MRAAMWVCSAKICNQTYACSSVPFDSLDRSTFANKISKWSSLIWWVRTQTDPDQEAATTSTQGFIQVWGAFTIDCRFCVRTDRPHGGIHSAILVDSQLNHEGVKKPTVSWVKIWIMESTCLYGMETKENVKPRQLNPFRKLKSFWILLD